MKSAREYLASRIKAEKPAFEKVMKAVPEDKLDYRPHPKSMSAQDLVWLLACELGDAAEVIDTGKAEWKQIPAPKALAPILELYEKNCERLEKKLAAVSDATWDGKAQYLAGGKVVWEATVGDMLWGFHLDAIHHRGQLSTYLRPMGAKVPSIYGPSGDDPGGK